MKRVREQQRNNATPVMRSQGMAGGRVRIPALAAALALALFSGVADAGLVSHWPAEQSAADAADGNDGVTNGVTFAPGIIGHAFVFNGHAGSSIYVVDAANLRFPDGTSFTFTAWVKTTAADFFFHDILRKRNRDAPGGALDLKLTMTSTLASPASKPQFYLVNNLGGREAIVYGTTSINDGQWHHLAGVYDSVANTMRLYVDVVWEGGTASISGDFTPISPAANWNIGNNPGSPKSPWLGQIDDVTVWNEALSSEEVAAMYSLGNDAILNYAADDVARLLALHDAGSGTTQTHDGRIWKFVADGLIGNGSVQDSGTFSVELGAAGSGVRVYDLGTQGLLIQIR